MGVEPVTKCRYHAPSHPSFVSIAYYHVVFDFHNFGGVLKGKAFWMVAEYSGNSCSGVFTEIASFSATRLYPILTINSIGVIND